jgi:citrate lyase subunit beta / citryl-CoA lyase
MRSKLFVPGGRPELFAKALASAADALSLDLEDSVVDAMKAQARAHVSAFVTSDEALASAKLVIVRVNSADSEYFADDIRAVVRDGLGMLNLPKIETAAELRQVVRAIEAAERDNAVTTPMRLLVNIETPRALAHAAAIATADPRVAGLQVGLGDLFEPHGIDRADTANVHAALFAVRMAAAGAGIFAVDGAFADIDDMEGFMAEAGMARRAGFIGKSCVHPRQVAWANAAFAPSPGELAFARRVVAAARDAGEKGRGAFTVDGRMIDLPFLKRAQAIVASAR